jgi:DNA topoisomerase IA
VNLMIVERPGQARQVAASLGTGWQVEATLGPVRDLPTDALGIDTRAGFKAHWQVPPGRSNAIRKLVRAMREAEVVYLATDPDLEGEAIAGHLVDLAGITDKPIHRIRLSGHSHAEVQSALLATRPVNRDWVAAWETRRIVDRLVGYLVSPLASRALAGTHRIGRLTGVALRLLDKREQAIDAFHPTVSWSLALQLEAAGQSVTARLTRLRGEAPHFSKRETPEQLAARLQSAHFWIEQLKRTAEPDAVVAVRVMVGTNRAQPWPLAFEGEVGPGGTTTLPPLVPGQALTLVEPVIRQEQAAAPLRYTETSLLAAVGVKPLRTYHLSRGLLERGYAQQADLQLVPTASGQVLSDYLTQHFPDLFTTDSTAQLEGGLEAIAAGQASHEAVLMDFWSRFQPALAKAAGAVLPAADARPLSLRPALEGG